MGPGAGGPGGRVDGMGRVDGHEPGTDGKDEGIEYDRMAVGWGG